MLPSVGAPLVGKAGRLVKILCRFELVAPDLHVAIARIYDI